MTDDMNPQLKRLCDKLDRLDVGYTADAICDIREVLYGLIGFISMNMPEAKSDDQ